MKPLAVQSAGDFAGLGLVLSQLALQLQAGVLALPEQAQCTAFHGGLIKCHGFLTRGGGGGGGQHGETSCHAPRSCPFLSQPPDL